MIETGSLTYDRVPLLGKNSLGLPVVPDQQGVNIYNKDLAEFTNYSCSKVPSHYVSFTGNSQMGAPHASKASVLIMIMIILSMTLEKTDTDTTQCGNGSHFPTYKKE
jgi:hypothetical protein